MHASAEAGWINKHSAAVKAKIAGSPLFRAMVASQRIFTGPTSAKAEANRHSAW
ncbi:MULTISPECIES: hypothetical protein [unclassified Thiocapsa]|uniref:hypothetical protein n=1 Tax=unclassified Thiocapsa TaxID=2641286 RepID=UPI0035AFF326